MISIKPNLQAQGKWLFTKYDAFGRVVYTGLISSASDRLAQQTAADAALVLFESRTASLVTLGGGTDIRYTNIAYPTTGITELHTINYYDDYAFDTDGGFSETSYGVTPIVNAKSLPTGSKVRVLGTTQWTTTVTYYDDKARPVYVYSHNTYLGTTDKIKTKLDFIGKPLETSTVHTKDGLTTTVIEKFTYDHAGKVLAQTHQTNSNPAQRIADNTYDQLGQLKKKNVGGTTIQAALQNVDYAYNIRGWLKQINDPTALGNDLFGFKLSYNAPTHGATALYNGNIAETEWRTANTDNSLKWYSYGYDALNRILTATDNTAKFNLSGLSYDKNGNIMGLVRQGQTIENPNLALGAGYGPMDNLVYAYDSGNKLLKVTDNANDTYGFKDGVNTTNDFTYDVNGNMLSDANKGITGIVYNHLNLPTQVTMAGQNILYIYDAVGTKLRKTVSGITTDYAGNYVYENSVLQFFNTAEGYVEPNGTGWQYVYQYKDHLGNVRLSYADSNGDGLIVATGTGAEIREENNYYPFGLEHKGYNNVVNGTEYNFKTFQGKEEEKELGRNTYDFGWRAFDPAIARWTTIDPLAERRYELTPYNFVQNSPIFRIDPDGLTDFKLNKDTGEVEQVGEENKDPDRIVKTDKDGNVKKKGEGFLGFLVRKSERGKSKIAVSGIEKGILEDGKNLKTESTLVEVDLGNNLQDKGFEDSVLKISNYLDVELGGYYLTDTNDGKEYGYLHAFQSNDDQSAGTGLRLDWIKKPNLNLNQFDLNVRGHTHLSRFDPQSRLNPSSLGRDGGDLGSKRRALESNPTLKFFIITNPQRVEY